MRKVFLSLVFIGVLINGFANEKYLKIEKKILEDKTYSLRNFSEEDINNYFQIFKNNEKVQRAYSDYNANENIMKKIIDRYEISFELAGEIHNEYLYLYSLALNEDVGYKIQGEVNYEDAFANKPNLVCFYDNKETFGFEYLCGTASIKSGEQYRSWYAFNIENDLIKGKFTIGSFNEVLNDGNLENGIDFIGNRIENYNRLAIMLNNEFVTDLANKTHSIGWYFWMSDSGKAYLASSKYGENGDISVWNFTDEKKWRPIYNASAFDGYSSAGDTFSNVSFSTDKRTITFGTSLLTNEFTTDLANKTHSIGWYFWMSDSNKAYLASGRDSSKGIAIWNFTDERKWKPVHNAPAFDGYYKADTFFDNIFITDDGEYIDFEVINYYINYENNYHSYYYSDFYGLDGYYELQSAEFKYFNGDKETVSSYKARGSYLTIENDYFYLKYYKNGKYLFTQEGSMSFINNNTLKVNWIDGYYSRFNYEINGNKLTIIDKESFGEGISYEYWGKTN